MSNTSSLHKWKVAKCLLFLQLYGQIFVSSEIYTWWIGTLSFRGIRRNVIYINTERLCSYRFTGMCRVKLMYIVETFCRFLKHSKPHVTYKNKFRPKKRLSCDVDPIYLTLKMLFSIPNPISFYFILNWFLFLRLICFIHMDIYPSIEQVLLLVPKHIY